MTQCAQVLLHESRGDFIIGVGTGITTPDRINRVLVLDRLEVKWLAKLCFGFQH